MPTREEIKQRRLAVIASRANLAEHFQYMLRRINTALEYVQAECDHPAKARKSEYVGSHFERRCSDCGALLD
jgi:hypothetical protein